MSKIPNINCTFYTQFGRCTNKEYSKWFFNKECMLVGPVATCKCEYQNIHKRPPAPPAPPPKRKIAEDVSFFWSKEEKIYGEECFIVASAPYIDKVIGISSNKNQAIELRDLRNKNIGLDTFRVYKALISIEK